MKWKFIIYRRKDSEKHSTEFAVIQALQAPLETKTNLKEKKRKLQIDFRKYYNNSRPKDKFNKADVIRILTELKFPFNKP